MIRALQEKGFEVEAISPHDGCETAFATMGITHHGITIDQQGISPRRDVITLFQYHRILKRSRPDVLLNFTPKPNIYGSLAAWALGIPVINNVAGLGTAFIRGGLLRRIVALLYKIAFRNSRTVFFQNDDDLAMFVSAGWVGEKQARLLPGSGIDVRRFRMDDDLSVPAKTVVFLLVARLLWDKGIGEFVAAARRIRAAYPDARFQVLGFLEVANRTAVPRSDVEGWVADGIIDYLGSSADVRPFIADADCVVLPSYREGLPRTLLEGAAMGKPLVATDVPGCRDVVEDGLTGFLCRPRDANALARACMQILALSPDERAEMGRAGRRKVETQFDERIVVARYLTAIDQALAGDLKPLKDDVP